MKIITIKKHTQSYQKALGQAFETLKRGGLVIFPTDTVYGALVDAKNKAPVSKLIQFKNRPIGKPISVFFSRIEELKPYVEVDKRKKSILQKLLPGPFTIILNSKHKVSALLESEKGTLGVRIPDYPLVRELVRKIGGPITATSANVSGHSPHYQIASLLRELSSVKKKLIDLVIDAGKLPHNKPSTVVDLTSSHIKIIRQGDIVFRNEQTFISDSPSQTRRIAQCIFKKALLADCAKPLVFLIEGELGVGKTIFVKGLGEALGIDNIISPTFVICYEYGVNSSLINKFVHVDLYNIEQKEEFKNLGLEQYLKKGNILSFEWGEKAGEIIGLLKNKAKIIYIKMKYLNEKKREIIIN